MKKRFFAFNAVMALSLPVFAVGPIKGRFETSQNIRALLDSYKQHTECSTLSDQELFDMACLDWNEMVEEEARTAKPLESLPAEEVIVNGVTYRLYGYSHGERWPFETMSKAYREFVRNAYKRENDRIASSTTFILAERNLRDSLNIEDNYIIDVNDHSFDESDLVQEKSTVAYKVEISPVAANFIYALTFYYVASFVATLSYFSEPITDITDTLGIFHDYRERAYNLTSDSMNVDISNFRAILPSKYYTQLVLLSGKNESEMDLEGYPIPNCFTRSLYMAGFLKGFAEKGNYSQLPFFMGRSHLVQVKGFLLDSIGYAEQTASYKNGHERGSALAEKLLEAQRNHHEDELLSAIAAWNPERGIEPSLAKKLAKCIVVQTPSELFAFFAGLAVQAGLTYYFLTKAYYCFGRRTM